MRDTKLVNGLDGKKILDVQFPNAPIYTNTHNIALDPCLVDTTLRGHCPTGRGCDICRREFWMQEVE